MEIRNAVIKKAYLFTTKGMLSASLELDLGDSFSGQVFGLNRLYSSLSGCNGKNYAGYFLFYVLRVADVNNWDALVGKTIRIKTDENGCVEAIGHIVNDLWLSPKDVFEEIKQVSSADAENINSGNAAKEN
jgi:hypothetical protein